MVITFDLVELPLFLPQSSLYGQKGHRVVGLDAATSVRAQQVARHPTTLFQNEIFMPKGHTASMKIWYRPCDGWRQGRQFLVLRTC